MNSTHLPGPGPFNTVANWITAFRTVAALVLGFIAMAADDRVPWLIAAYATYWIGDSLDGLAARLMDQETRAGAVFDISTDRLCTGLLAAICLLEKPELAPAIFIFLLNYMVIDNVISLSFLLWPLVSLNYFYEVDRKVYLVNWSHPAKALNNVGIIVAIVIGNLPLAMVIVIAQIAVKIWSAARIGQLAMQRELVA